MTRLALVSAILLLMPAPVWADAITLSWTAPGDDDLSGRASAYELRYSTQPLLAGGDAVAWWNAATPVPSLPAPQSSGTRESFTVSGLVTGTTYYFVIRTADEVPNWSLYSNVSARQAGAGSGGALATPASFQARPVPGGVALDWEEPVSGAGSGYRLYRHDAAAGTDTLLATLAVGALEWIDASAAGGATYEYRLATYQGSTEGTPALASVSVPTDRLAHASAAIRGYPNPARGKVTLRFQGGGKDGAPGRVRVVIYDLTGHQVCRLIDREIPAGEQAIEWSCRSDTGHAVAPGLYNVILDGPSGRTVTRVAIVP